MQSAAYGTFAPITIDRAIMNLTSRLPHNWAGLRLAILLRRAVTMRLNREDGLDVERWGMRMRLHPLDNGCEKNLLFTPQMFEPLELRVLREALQVAPATFVDIGANVGLWSLFAASVAPHAKIVAIEPERGNLERLHFNLQCNPGLPIRVVEAALGSTPGELGVVLHHADRGGTRTVPVGAEHHGTVQCLALLDVLRNEGVSSIDALKIDVEGAEDAILGPFFREAGPSLWPRLIIIEDTRALWSTDLFGYLKKLGYNEKARTRANVILCGT